MTQRSLRDRSERAPSGSLVWPPRHGTNQHWIVGRRDDACSISLNLDTEHIAVILSMSRLNSAPEQ